MGLCKKYQRFQDIKSCFRRLSWKSKTHECTGKKWRSAVLNGPRNLKLEFVPERVIQPHQVRIDVHYCGLSGIDALLWTGNHYRIPEPNMVLGFEITGTILEMGKIAYEKTGYQRGEIVVAHGYPDCGGFAEVCLVDYRGVFRLSKRVSMENAVVIIEDYVSSLLALGRRIKIQNGEYFLVNSNTSRTALAVIDLASRIFGAKPISICNDSIREEICYELGAVAVIQAKDDFQKMCSEIGGNNDIRVMVETDGGSYSENNLKCLQFDGSIALVNGVFNWQSLCFYLKCNYMVLTVSTEHCKRADTLAYREIVEHLLDYGFNCIIRPRISAIFGLEHISCAFNYYISVPNGKVLIDLKNHDRATKLHENLPTHLSPTGNR